MHPQTSIPVAANVLGTIGTVCWCIQLAPQIWHNWRQKSTDGLPGLMMFIWALSALPLGVYTVVQNFNIPMQIQPAIFCVLSLVSWAQTLIYSSKWPTWKASLVAGLAGASFGGIEAILILFIRPVYARGVTAPIMIVGTAAAILLAAGLIPPYFELWKRSGRVVGINFYFLTIDLSGGVFSLLGVVTQNTFDILGGWLFIVCILLEIGIFTSHGIWLFRTRKLRAAAKAAGKDFDDMPESDVYHVDVPRKGSIAASRNVLQTEIQRKGSVSLAKDLELGLQIAKFGTAGGDEDGEKSKAKADVVTVTCEEVRPDSRDGVQSIDYGTMERTQPPPPSRGRPGFKRQDTDISVFRELRW